METIETHMSGFTVIWKHWDGSTQRTKFHLKDFDTLGECTQKAVEFFEVLLDTEGSLPIMIALRSNNIEELT